MLRGKLIQFLFQQDVLGVDVGVNQAELSLVRRVLEGCTDDLEHGCNSGTTCDHTEGTRKGRCVGELTLGTLDADVVADFEEGDVFGNVTLLVCLLNVNDVISVIHI